MLSHVLTRASTMAAAASALLCLAGAAAAQGYGQPPYNQQQPMQQQPYAQPGFGPQPGFGQNPPQGQPGFNQPGPNQPGMEQGGVSLTGAWSGDKQDQNGVMRLTEYFGPDGSYVTAGMLGNGLMFRGWGTYRTQQTAQNQFRVEVQLQGYLPQQLCGQPPGGAPQNCVPFQLPPTSVSVLTFTSLSSFQEVALTVPDGGSINMSRDANPYLLQRQVPPQGIINVPAPPQQQVQQQPYVPVPAPTAPAYRPSYRTSPISPRNSCPNDDIQRSVCKYSGRLITSGGCLQCVGG